MPYINNLKLKEIKEAAKNGNEKAKKILKYFSEGTKQDEINKLIEDYYEVGVPKEIEKEEKIEEKENDNDNIIEEETIKEVKEEKQLEDNSINKENEKEKIFESIDNDVKKRIEENDIQTITFSDFLKNKEKDNLKANGNCFRIYNDEDKNDYIQRKINTYKDKFNDLIYGNQRKYDDMENAINMYFTKLNEEENNNDDIEIVEVNVDSVYDNLTKDNNFITSFERYWDERDLENTYSNLLKLSSEFGKRNVIAALNVLKKDIENYKNFLDNKIDEEIKRYSKSLEILFK